MGASVRQLTDNSREAQPMELQPAVVAGQASGMLILRAVPPLSRHCHAVVGNWSAGNYWQNTKARHISEPYRALLISNTNYRSLSSPFVDAQCIASSDAVFARYIDEIG